LQQGARAAVATPVAATAPVATSPLLAGTAVDTPTVLFIDTGRQISAAAQGLISYLVESGPPWLHLVLATRGEPAVPLLRLRLTGELLELRDDDVRWNAAEAAALLHGPLGLGLKPLETAALLRATGGWVTGLCLAAGSLRARASIAASFTGADPSVVDYIAREVLEGQPAMIQEFLLRTASLPELDAHTCAAAMRGGASAVGGELSDVRAALEYIERNNLFLTATDAGRTRFRYEPLIAEALQALRSRGLGTDPSQRRAAAVGPVGAGLRAGSGPHSWAEEQLSDREHQILALAAEGRGNREIAELLWISEGTVKSHLKRIFSKLGARNRTEAAAIARNRRILLSL
jgi:LuxR family maltose regulon positive regulatory protein